MHIMHIWCNNCFEYVHVNQILRIRIFRLLTVVYILKNYSPSIIKLFQRRRGGGVFEIKNSFCFIGGMPKSGNFTMYN